ncbi:hypothetical protein NTE_03475 [Candidatus Nitrososphaera evergladensis SR1]|uniref:Uncharacterized protein n=1 Tax=Candidatus Nitrososphaera evergladensis SR1 TaxID=1459636 RepID=A0A075MWJ9_9ARCH|nr:hypothetical protein NTE_03475 [Candidatus Nitrososphaera evergladensis SR1]
MPFELPAEITYLLLASKTKTALFCNKWLINNSAISKQLERSFCIKRNTLEVFFNQLLIRVIMS